MVKLTKVSLTTKSDVNAVSESSVKMKTKLKNYKFWFELFSWLLLFFFFFFDDDGFQIMFVYQPNFNTLELKNQGHWISY